MPQPAQTRYSAKKPYTLGTRRGTRLRIPKDPKTRGIQKGVQYEKKKNTLFGM